MKRVFDHACMVHITWLWVCKSLIPKLPKHWYHDPQHHVHVDKSMKTPNSWYRRQASQFGVTLQSLPLCQSVKRLHWYAGCESKELLRSKDAAKVKPKSCFTFRSTKMIHLDQPTTHEHKLHIILHLFTQKIYISNTPFVLRARIRAVERILPLSQEPTATPSCKSFFMHENLAIKGKHWCMSFWYQSKITPA